MQAAGKTNVAPDHGCGDDDNESAVEREVAASNPAEVDTKRAKLAKVYLALGSTLPTSTSAEGRRSAHHSITVLSKELQIAQQARDLRRQARAYALLGQAYKAVGALERSASAYENNLRLCREMHDPVAEASASCELAAAYKVSSGGLCRSPALLCGRCAAADTCACCQLIGFNQLAQGLFEEQARSAGADPPARKAQSEVGAWMTAVLEYRIHEKCYVAQPEAGAQHSLSKARSEYRVCRKDSLLAER